MAHETVIRSSLLVRDVQNPNTTVQKFAVFTGSGNNDINLLGFRTANELLSDIGFNEAVDDRVSTLLQAGANITLNYDDNGNTLTIAAPNTITGTGTANQVTYWTGTFTQSGSGNLLFNYVTNNVDTPNLYLQTNFTGIAPSPISSIIIENKNETVGGSDYQNEVNLILKAGTTTDHRRYITWKRFNNLDAWKFGINAQNRLITYNSIGTVHRLLMNQVSEGGHTYLNTEDTGSFIINQSDASENPAGTGGVKFYSGGAYPSHLVHNFTTNDYTFTDSSAIERAKITLTDGLLIQPSSGNMFTGKTNAGSIRFVVDQNGNTAFSNGGTAVSSTATHYRNSNSTAGTGSYYGLHNQISYNPSSDNSSINANLYAQSSISGINQVRHYILYNNLTNSNTNTNTRLGGVYGIITNNSETTVNSVNLLEYLFNNNAGTINDYNGIAISSPSNAGIIVNGSGIRIARQRVGTWTNNTYAIRTDGADDLNAFIGSVGIGTFLPSAKIHVVGLTASSSTWTAQFHNSGGTNNALMIRDDGNVGVGTSGTTARLQVVSSNNSNSTWTAQFHNNTGSNNALMIRDDGRVGIGTATPSETLHVAGTMRLTGSTGTGTTLMARNVDGDVSAITLGSGLSLSNNSISVSTSGTTIVTGTGTATQVAFWDNTTSLAGNSNLYWDDVNSRLGVGITTPTSNLDVVGSVEFQNPTTDYDGGVLGSELLTTGTGTNWTGTSFATGYVHATGSTVALVSSASISSGQFYQVVVTVSGRTTGSITFSIGGYINSSIATNTTTTVGPLTTSTDSFTVTPTTDFNGTVSASVKVITAGSVSFVCKNSAGTTVYEERISSFNSNIFQGINAGRLNTTGIQNVFQGVNAGSSNTTGSSNFFQGANAGLSNTTGSNNIFQGRDTGVNNTTGFNNTFQGVSAGGSNTTGHSNFFQGTNAGALNTTGIYNVFQGVNAGLSNTTGSNNTLIGYQAGRYVAGGLTGNTLITNSILIGFDTRALASGQTNQVVVGYNGRGLGSNTTVIGNTSTVQTHLHGSLTLGSTTSPAARMVVTGPQPSGTTTWTAQFHNSLGNSNSLMIRDDGNVGVGTNTPNFKLHVQANGAGLFVSGANVSPFNQIIASFVYGGNGNTINVENAGDRASFQARATTAVGAAASSLFLNPNGGTVSINNSAPDASAIFDVRSTTQGFLPPRMTSVERDAIATPATGLQVYNSSLNVMQHYNGVSWVNEANPILTRVSTGTTQVELFLDGVSSRFGLVGTNKVWNFRIQLCAIVASAGTGTLDLSDSYISEHLIGIKRSGSSINVVGGGVVQNLIGANTQMEDSVVTITGDSGTESIRVFYTPPSGAAANTVIRISATLYYTEAGV